MTRALPPAVTSFANPHYALIGGAAGVSRLVGAFYRRMDTLPEAAAIRAMHEADLSRTKVALELYLSQWLGGPKDYTAQRGQPRLRMRHAAFRIGPAERDAWLACMRGAFDDVVPDACVREQLMESFFKTADWLRNTPGNPHDSHH